ncbi:MAG: glucosyl-3-phosphoglycerate synthase [Acidimicrobiales bacterium]
MMERATGTGGGVRRFAATDRTIADVVAAKRGRTVAVCIPCRDEGATIGSLVRSVRSTLMTDGAVHGGRAPEGGPPLVDELIVMDDNSIDDTAAVATEAGATVVPIDDIHLRHGGGAGKGTVLWASLLASTADILVWIDGDLTSFEPAWVAGLAAPLLTDPSVALVKADAHRPQGRGGGGRTTELVVRPLLSLYFPRLAGLHQPLAGEYAVRRSVVEQLPFRQGWGVEIALLIDIAHRWGPEAIAQVELGVREHSHRPLESLSVQAAEVMATILDRIPDGSLLPSGPPVLRRPDGSVVALNLGERPPVASLAGRGNGVSLGATPGGNGASRPGRPHP